MENLRIAFTAVLPFLLYLVFGYLLRRFHVVDEPFLHKLNAFVFKAFFFFMMFHNVSGMSRDGGLSARFLLISVGVLLAVILLLLLFVPRLVKDPKKAGVVIQGIYRSNAILFAIPMAQSVYGEEMGATAALLVAIFVPIYNVVAVLVLEHFGNAGHKPIGEMLLDVLKNPIILGAIVGFLFWLFNISLPGTINSVVNVFADMCTPLAVIVMGGTLHWSGVVSDRKYIAWTLGVKLVLLPAIIIAISVLLGMEPYERFILFIVFATPTAVSSFPMAESMGCDGQLAGEVVSLGTVVSILTLFLWIFGLRQFALI